MRTPCSLAGFLLASVVCSCSLLVGCLESEVGAYRIDEAFLLAASCTGVDVGRSASWSQALAAEPLEDMQVASSGSVSQAQFFRTDSSVVFVAVGEVGDRRFAGQRVVDGTTVLEAELGGDFSGLLEGQGAGCHFDLAISTEFDFGESGWGEASGQVLMELSQADVDGCPIDQCTAEFNFRARHTGSTASGFIEANDLPD